VPVWNFAFGSHLKKEQFCKIIGGEPADLTKAVLNDCSLTFWKASNFPKEFAYLANGGTPALFPKEGSRVYGVAYLISEEQLELLNSYEAKWDYELIEVQIDSDKFGSIHALAHNRIKMSEFAPPSPEFLKLMIDGLRELGYPKEIVANVEKASSEPIG
jgi:hypothetical protein